MSAKTLCTLIIAKADCQNKSMSVCAKELNFTIWKKSMTLNVYNSIGNIIVIGQVQPNLGFIPGRPSSTALLSEMLWSCMLLREFYR